MASTSALPLCSPASVKTVITVNETVVVLNYRSCTCFTTYLSKPINILFIDQYNIVLYCIV